MVKVCALSVGNLPLHQACFNGVNFRNFTIFGKGILLQLSLLLLQISLTPQFTCKYLAKGQNVP